MLQPEKKKMEIEKTSEKNMVVVPLYPLSSTYLTWREEIQKQDAGTARE